MIGVLKSLGFLDEGGTPRQRYFDYLDQGQSQRVLAEAMREAYADLYQLNNRAEQLSRADVKGKMKTLTQGKYTDSVIDKMVSTFFALAKHADFDAPPPARPAAAESSEEEAPEDETPEPEESGDGGRRRKKPPVELGGLVYTIQIQLPDTRDPAVYDALFTSLRTHLLT